MKRGRLGTFIGSFVVLAVSVQSASADIIQIQLGGVDLRYNGVNIVDAGTSSPDPLTNATFLLNSAPLGADTTGVSLDLFVPGVLNIPVGGGQVNSAVNGTLYLDLGGGEFVSLVLGSARITYVPVSSNIQFVFIGSASNVVGQQLPYNLLMVDPVTVTFSTQTIQPVSHSGGFLTVFKSAGTGELQAEQYVPEPAMLGVLAVGGLALLRRRRT